MSLARERVELSRARLKLAMLPPPPPPIDVSGTKPQSWLDKLSALPLVHAVIDSVGSWWAHHPLRPAAQVAGEASNAMVRPIAQRNPVALVAVAALVGAGLAWGRPWRWMFRSALFAGLIPQLASRVVANLPVESWMTMVGSALSSGRPARQTTTQEAAASGAPVI